MDLRHTSPTAARKALAAAGYVSGFSSPGRPELWIEPKTKSRRAIARVNGREQWAIVPYPEPSTATVDEVIKLAKRDGIVIDADPAPSVDEDDLL